MGFSKSPLKKKKKKRRNERVFPSSISSLQDILVGVLIKIGKWAMESKEFKFLNIENILVNWEACMVCGSSRSINHVRWCPALEGVIKFNVHGMARSKPGRGSEGYFTISKVM